jgi:hypothetical protein
MEYTGTDVSPDFCEFVSKRWRLNTVNTDIQTLPIGPWDMVWCFDCLEHVRPEDRRTGYEAIDSVLVKENGLILVNAPVANWNAERREALSGHGAEFDHVFNETDILELNRICGTSVQKWEPYFIEEVNCEYVWVELGR